MKTRQRRIAAGALFNAARGAARGRRLRAVARLVPFIWAQLPRPAAAEVCEFNFLEQYFGNYTRLADLLGYPQQQPPAGEFEYFTLLQSRGIHYSGAIGSQEYLFISAMIGILAPQRVVEIGTSSGFSAALIAAALRRTNPSATGTLVDTIDLHTKYIVDQTKPIGFAIAELVPELESAIRVHTGPDSTFVSTMAAPNELQIVFIDADHQHPWPLLDLLRVAPYVRADGWIVLHDIQLGTMGAIARAKGAPFPYGAPFGAEWLFERWPFRKISGGNIGAVQLPSDKRNLVPIALDLMALPFEMSKSAHPRMRAALYESLMDLTEACAPEHDL